jgi:hypothetical protein
MRFAGLFLIAALSGACGGESTSNNESQSNASQNDGKEPPEASGGGGREAGTGGTPSFVPDQGCATDADCMLGERCLRYTATGPSECVAQRLPATGCHPPNDRDQCCTSEDCKSGSCFTTVTAAGPVCGLGGYDAFNQCLDDTCVSDTDCNADEACLPNGFGDLRACMPASCRTDADCTAAAGGACIAFGDRCCANVGPSRFYRPKQLTCVYASDGCKEDVDCPTAQYCVVEGGRAHCSRTCQ